MLSYPEKNGLVLFYKIVLSIFITLTKPNPGNGAASCESRKMSFQPISICCDRDFIFTIKTIQSQVKGFGTFLDFIATCVGIDC